jgi:hypothetical protein
MLILFAYYFLFFKQKQELIKSNNLNDCLTEAENSFQERIKNEGVTLVDSCTEGSIKINPYQTESEARIGCTNAVVGGISRNKDDKINVCYKKYPQN